MALDANSDLQRGTSELAQCMKHKFEFSQWIPTLNDMNGLGVSLSNIPSKISP
jgi:hypothetical protein